MSHAEQYQSTETANLNRVLAFDTRLNRLHRLFKTHFNVTEPSIIIEPYLFLGNCISAHDTNRLSKLGIRYILNVAIRDVELCPYYSSDIRTLSIDLRDDDRENIIRIFDQAFNFIDEAKHNKSRVLVHCSHGQSRSPAIVIAYLMRTYNVSLEQCLVHVIKARPCVLPNDGFLKQLILFDRFLVERRRQREEAAAKEAANAVPTQEIQIQYKPLVASPQPLELNVPTRPNSSKKLPMKTPATHNRRSSAVSTVEEKNISNLQSVESNDSIHFIPIQVQTKKSRSEKTKQIAAKSVPAKSEKLINDMKMKVQDVKEEITKIDTIEIAPTISTLETQSSSCERSLRKCPSAYTTSTARDVTSPTLQFHSIYPGYIQANSYENFISPCSNREWDDFGSYHRSSRRPQGSSRTKYITEIFDRATNRFIRVAC